jgi:hypothetical protein
VSDDEQEGVLLSHNKLPRKLARSTFVFDPQDGFILGILQLN